MITGVGRPSHGISIYASKVDYNECDTNESANEKPMRYETDGCIELPQTPIGYLIEAKELIRTIPELDEDSI
jgi:hypothetical protein